MADQDLWRKNIPDDFDGRQGDHWDDEIDVGVIVKTSIGVAVTVAIGFVFCWYFMIGLGVMSGDDREVLFELPREELLPPTPRLQASPEAELDEMLHEETEHLASYGWVDEMDGRVHLPVDRAMEIVLTDHATEGSPEPAVDPSVDAAVAGDDVHEETGDPGDDTDSAEGGQASDA